jgi:acetylornithine deacetylase/succinyl-diaminopimelate desuccinylase-like protein
MDLNTVFDQCLRILKDFVSIPFVSNGENNSELMRQSVNFVQEQFIGENIKTQVVHSTIDGQKPGNLAIIGYKGAGIGGEVDPNKPTVLLYAHHDVQPVQHPENWETAPWTATQIGERLYGRGAADDGAGIVAHIGALKLLNQVFPDGNCPVNVKIFIEGEEEIGSPSFANFIKEFRSELAADVIVVADSGNWQVGVPAITTTLRGIVTIDVELKVLEHSVHSGMSSGPIVDANSLLMWTISSIWDTHTGEIVVSGLLGSRPNSAETPITEPTVDYTEEQFRNDNGILDGVELAGSGTITGRIWAKPSVAVIGFDATSVEKSSNVFAPSARARLSLRVAPGQPPEEAAEALVNHLKRNVPLNAHFTTTIQETGPAFQADLTSPATAAFEQALETSFGTKPVRSGMGGSIPFTADLAEVFPDAQILLAGVEDPDSRAHSDNESVHLGDLKKLIHAEYLLLSNGNLKRN